MKRRVLASVLGIAIVTSTANAGLWPTETDRIAHQLESADPTERRAAAARLGALPTHLATALVTQALSDPDLDVRLAAAQAAIAHQIVAARMAVVPWLNEPDARVRLAACQVLRPGPPDSAVAPLSRVLGDADLRVRQAAAQALGSAGSTDAVMALLGHLDDPAADVRVAVIDALWRLGDARAVVPLGGKVADSAPEVRRAVARALGELGDKRAASALILALRDQSKDVRVEALVALGNLGEPTSVLAIAPHASPPSPPDVRRAALSALGRIGGDKALSILIGALDQDELGAGKAPARDALVAMGRPAVPSLLAALGAASSEAIASSAAEALGSLHAPEAREPISRALQKGALPKAAALRALASLGDPAALGVALELLSDRSPQVRAEARRATEALLAPSGSHGQAVDPIAAALDDQHASMEERAALARLLGRTRAARAAPKLAGLAGSQSLSLRLAAIDALGALGDSGNDAPLLVAIDDENPFVRARAGEALGRAASEATLVALLDRVGSAKEQDRSALATALSGALARVTSAAAVAQTAKLLSVSDGKMRDALVEGLGRTTQSAALAEVVKLAGSTEPADRRKAAESLVAGAAAATLRSLLADYDAGVRANAAWSLGQVGDASDVAKLAPLLTDSSAAVAANAAVAMGRIAIRSSKTDETNAALCGVLRDGRSYVRSGALAGLRAARSRCGDTGDVERALLAADSSPVVRAAAADLLRAAPSKDLDRDRRSLSRCRTEDPYGSVAARCASTVVAPDDKEPVSVLVVPDGQARPLAEAPFALVLADGTIRHGVADRRGAVFERAAPRGVVSLDVPAPFSR